MTSYYWSVQLIDANRVAASESGWRDTPDETKQAIQEALTRMLPELVRVYLFSPMPQLQVNVTPQQT